jgi:hypothetical protein
LGFVTRSPTTVKSLAKPSGVHRSKIRTPRKDTHEYRNGRYEKMSEKKNSTN